MFDNFADAVLSFLLLLENTLKWFPLRTVVLGIALLSWWTVMAWRGRYALYGRLAEVLLTETAPREWAVNPLA